VVLGGAALLGLGIVLYAISTYAWTQERHFANLAGPLFYYVFPGLLVFVALGGGRLPAESRTVLAVCFVGMACGALVCEFCLAIVPFPREVPLADRAKAAGSAYDTRRIHQVIADLQRDYGRNVVPFIASSILIRDNPLHSPIKIGDEEVVPLAGVAHTLTAFCNESGVWIHYESDEHGFHNPPGMWNAQKAEVVALGDSFTQGDCVPANRNFVALIRKQFPKTLNLGIVGNGPLAELATLREYGQYVKPERVLWFYFEGNDLIDLIRERKNPLLMRYASDSDFTQHLLMRQRAIDSALTEHIQEKYQAFLRERAEETVSIPRKIMEQIWFTMKLSRLRWYVRTATSREGQIPDRAARELPFELFEEILRMSRDLAHVGGGTFYFVYLPAGSRYADRRWSGSGIDIAARNARGKVLDIVSRLGIPVIDMLPVFDAHPDPLSLFPFRIPSHYTEEGNKLVADTILSSLTSAIFPSSKSPL